MHPFVHRRGVDSPSLAQVAKAVLKHWNGVHPDMPMRLRTSQSARGRDKEQEAFALARGDGSEHPLILRWSESAPGRILETSFRGEPRTHRAIDIGDPDFMGTVTGVLYERRGAPYGLGDMLRTVQSGLDADPGLRDAFRVKYEGPYPGVSDHHLIEVWPNKRVPGCLVHGVRVRVEDNRAQVVILRYGCEDLGEGLTVRPLLGTESRPWHRPTSPFLAADLTAALLDNPLGLEPWVGLDQGTHPRTREVHVEVKAVLDALNESHPGDEEYGPTLRMRLNDARNLKVGAPDVLGFRFYDGTEPPLSVRVGDEGAEILAGEEREVVATFDYMSGLEGMREELLRLAEPHLAQAPAMPAW